MAKELYHFYFKRKHKSIKMAILAFAIPLIVLFSFIGILHIFIYIKKFPHILELFLEWGVLYAALIALIGYTLDRLRGGSVGASEFILYDNGWFVFFDEYHGSWIAPAKLEWVFPEGIEIRPLNIRSKEESPKHHYKYIFVRKRKDSRYLVDFGLIWAYPDKKWENWAFNGYISGWIEEEDYRKLLEMTEIIRKKAKENLESGRIKIPGNNPKQQHLAYYQFPDYWNEVFVKENIRELYIKENGEDLPEPVRSYLFDMRTYDKVYLKNKKKTGDWFGMSEKK